MKTGLLSEIEVVASHSRDAFDRCYVAASRAVQIHGRVDVGFTVLPDGRVGNVHIVQDTTGAPGLAACLGGPITRWTFIQHPAAPAEFVRPFTY